MKEFIRFLATIGAFALLASIAYSLRDIARKQIEIIRVVDGAGSRVEINNCDMRFFESTNNKPSGIIIKDGPTIGNLDYTGRPRPMPEPPFPPFTNVTFLQAWYMGCTNRPHWMTAAELERYYARQPITPDRRVYRSPRHVTP